MRQDVIMRDVGGGRLHVILRINWREVRFGNYLPISGKGPVAGHAQAVRESRNVDGERDNLIAGRESGLRALGRWQGFGPRIHTDTAMIGGRVQLDAREPRHKPAFPARFRARDEEAPFSGL
jgi:hypothetical protein